MKLPVPNTKTMLYMIDRAQKRYDACLKVYGARSSHTRGARKTLETYLRNARERGQIE
ncbi:MAG: hypothetical protein ACRC16_22070 [Aeromonas salmonicida]